jgi:hypothetical protein
MCTLKPAARLGFGQEGRELNGRVQPVSPHYSEPMYLAGDLRLFPEASVQSKRLKPGAQQPSKPE